MSRYDPLVRVKRAADRKRRAERDYYTSLQEAHAAGSDYAVIARAAGVSRQAVRQLLLAERRKT